MKGTIIATSSSSQKFYFKSSTMSFNFNGKLFIASDLNLKIFSCFRFSSSFYSPVADHFDDNAHDFDLCIAAAAVLDSHVAARDIGEHKAGGLDSDSYTAARDHDSCMAEVDSIVDLADYC